MRIIICKLTRSLCYAAAGFLSAVPSGAFAQDYPIRPVTIVVPYAAGGAGDLTTRIFAQQMSQMVREPVVVLNRPGAGFGNSAGMVAQARPDGYTIFLSGNGAAIASVLFKSLPYKLSDFKDVSSIAFFGLVLLVDGDSPFKSVADLLAYAKAHPGTLNIGTVAAGSTQNLAANLFKVTCGDDMQVVPFETTSQVVSALRGGDVQAALEIISPVLGQISSKTVRALAVTSSARFPGLPDVPTLAESGLRGYEASSWSGLSVPAGTPDAIVNKLAAQTASVLQTPEVKQKMQMLGAQAKASSPSEMTGRMQADTAKWKAVIERAGISTP